MVHFSVTELALIVCLCVLAAAAVCYLVMCLTTERKESNNKLQQLSTAVEQSPVSVVITNTRGIIEYVNPKFCQITGYDLDEVIGRSPNILKSGVTQKEDYRELWETIAKGESWTGEFHNRKKNGELFWERASIGPIIDSSGKITHYLAIKEDITDSKQKDILLTEINQQLQQSAAAAKELQIKAECASRAKSVFLSNISHEIRTPLNGIIGMLHLLGQSEMSQEQRHFARTALRSSGALLNLLNDVLDYSRLEVTKVSIHLERVPLRGFLEDIAEVFCAGAVNKGLDFVCELPWILPEWIEVDPNRLRQVVSNLLGNAIKFTEAGEIVLSASITSPINGSPALLCIEVNDTGIGIPSDMKSSIFQPFVQVDNSHTRTHSGSGLGLSICQQLVELMGGTLGYVDRAGGGVSFRIELKVMRGPSESQVDAILRGKQILIADSSPVFRRSIGAWLQQLGATLVETSDLEAAVGLMAHPDYSQSAFSYVFLDGRLGGSDWKCACPGFTSNVNGCSVNVVGMRYWSVMPERELTQASTCLHCLMKPLRKNSFLQLFKLQPAEESSPLVSSQNGTTEMPTGTILLAEDNPVNKRVTSLLLQRKGLIVHTVDNGAQAVAAVTKSNYDLILMDLQMPVMDGIEATRVIREMSGTAQIPIIALTAMTGSVDRDESVGVGMNGWLTKPIQPDLLMSEVAKHLHAARERRNE